MSLNSEKYTRRKNKNNTIAKTSSIEYRFIVNRSNKYNYWMIIDKTWKVFAMMSDKSFNKDKKVENAKKLWLKLAETAMQQWIKKVVFDRNWHLYHGRIASMCDWLREWWVLV